MGSRKQEFRVQSPESGIKTLNSELQTLNFYGQAVATRDAYGATLVELGKRNEKVVVLDADLSGSTKTAKFAKAFPERFFNMGISEQDMVGTAGGLSLAGKIPFASTFAIFETGRAWEQIRQTVCYSHLNVKLVATHSGLTVGEDGASHQALEDVALMRVLPELVVIVPSDGFETQQVIDAIAEYEGPVYVRLGRAKVPAVMPPDYKFQIGKAHTFHLGKDANIIADGIMVAAALQARETLLKEGIDAGVINMSTVKPLDAEALLKAANASKLIVTAEEHSVIGGLGGAVAEYLSENHPVAVKRIGTRDTFGGSGKPDDLLKLYGLTADDIVKTIKSALSR
ncbi:MAG: transketolase family protein [Nitrospirae bacterium]|nr:transketolase family protein [Nitrospirota bacterium]MCL5977717.1 transketolase family protein [Nitrospirota bacterium]